MWRCCYVRPELPVPLQPRDSYSLDRQGKSIYYRWSFRGHGHFESGLAKVDFEILIQIPLVSLLLGSIVLSILVTVGLFLPNFHGSPVAHRGPALWPPCERLFLLVASLEYSFICAAHSSLVQCIPRR